MFKNQVKIENYHFSLLIVLKQHSQRFLMKNHLNSQQDPWVYLHYTNR